LPESITLPSSANLDFDNTVAVDDEGIDITAGTVDILNTVTVTSDGAVEITNSELLTIANGVNMTLDGAFLQNGAGNVSLGGGIETDNADITFERTVTLTAAGPVTLASDGGNIVFEQLLAGSSDYGESLTLDAGSGSILFTKAVGSQTIALGDLNITGASGGVTESSGIYAKSVSITDGGTVAINDEVIVRDGFSSAGRGDFQNVTAAAITTGGDIVIDHSGDVTIRSPLVSGAAIDIDSGGDLVLDEAINTVSDGNISLDADNSITITSSGDITASGAGSVSFGENKSGGLNISGDIITVGGNVTFNVATTIGRDLTIDTGALVGGNIVFNENLEGQTAGAQGLDLIPGTGSVTFSGDVGETQLGALTIESDAGGVTANGSINAASLVITDGGPVALSGTVTVAGGFSSTGTTFDHTGGLITTSGNSIVIDHTGNVTLGAGLSSNDGKIDIDAGGAILMEDTALVDAGTGLIDLTATGNLTLGGLKTTQSGNAVNLTSTAGAIIDGGDTYLEVDAPNGYLDMTAANGIGEGNPLEINVAKLSARVTGAGAIQINEQDAIELVDVDTNNGSIQVTTSGDLTATDVQTGGNGTISLNSNNMNLGTLNAGNGPIDLNASGTIDGGTFTGGSATLTALTIGLTVQPTANVANLSMTLSGQNGAGVSGKLLPGGALT
ncbi:beta strand repeat-containing protein, partial [Thermodesulfobacteriota bacterium]